MNLFYRNHFSAPTFSRGSSLESPGISNATIKAWRECCRSAFDVLHTLCCPFFFQHKTKRTGMWSRQPKLYVLPQYWGMPESDVSRWKTICNARHNPAYLDVKRLKCNFYIETRFFTMVTGVRGVPRSGCVATPIWKRAASWRSPTGTYSECSAARVPHLFLRGSGPVSAFYVQVISNVGSVKIAVKCSSSVLPRIWCRASCNRRYDRVQGGSHVLTYEIQHLLHIARTFQPMLVNIVGNWGLLVWLKSN